MPARKIRYQRDQPARQSGAGRRRVSRQGLRTDSTTSPPYLTRAVQEATRVLRVWRQHSAALQTHASRPPHQAAELHLDSWQRHAFDMLEAGHSVIVDAPTTAGKTRVVEAYFATHCHDAAFRAAYTTPVKSLSNDKVREFRDLFGTDNVGIATGDLKENLTAPIVVATLETYRNSLLGMEPDLGRTLVVFDEYQFFEDLGRGSAWEEAIILTPQTCQVLMLSASVGNPEEFRDWLDRLGKGGACRLVRAKKRPVPLEELLWHHGYWVRPRSLPAAIKQQLDPRRMRLPLRQNDLADRLVSLVALALTPCIVYAGRRRACEHLARLLAQRLEPLEEPAQRRIEATLAKAEGGGRGPSFIPPPLLDMVRHYGVAYHHSGLAPPARLAIEGLVKEGLIRFCSATMGLSLGINFSVRSVCISDYDRPGEGGITPYGVSDVLQMLGRAGRRGRDAVGFSIWPSLEAYRKLRPSRREPCNSRLRSDPTTYLGLVARGYAFEAIKQFYSLSFGAFQEHVARARGHRRRRPFRHPTSLSRLRQHLKRIGALDKHDRLTTYGSIARYFPQSGGLLMARMLAAGQLHAGNLDQAAELAAAFALARYKAPGVDPTYRLPFDTEALERAFERLYPAALFPELYEGPTPRQPQVTIREFNPDAGYLVKEWLRGMAWDELVPRIVTEHFGLGDVMSVLFRVGAYLQSVAQCHEPRDAAAARELRRYLLRPPLAFVLTV